jgi:Mce-associated membrane protein
MIDQDERPMAARSEESDPAVGRGTGRRHLRTARGMLARAAGAARAVPGIAEDRLRRAYDDAIARPVRAVRMLGVVVAVVAVLAGLCWFVAHRQSETQQARTDATNTANKSVVKLMSYNWRSVDRQVDATKDLVTGQFKDDYAQLVQGSIQPTAKDKQAAVQTAILKSSVVSSSPGEVVLLVYITQESQTLANPDGDQTNTALRVSLENENGKWMISELKPE